MKKGFTLLEILLVIAAIGILAAIVIVAINPNRQINQVNIARIESQARSIQQAVEQYAIDNNGYPSEIGQSFQKICTPGVDQVTCDSKGFLKLDDDLSPTYLGGLPSTGTSDDPDDSGYEIAVSPINDRISIVAPDYNVGLNDFTRQLAQVRNVERESEINAIFSAIQQYAIDNSEYPPGLENYYQDICSTTVTTNCIDLSVLAPTYLASIPEDPQGAVYDVALRPDNGNLSVVAFGSELTDGVKHINGFGLIESWEDLYNVRNELSQTYNLATDLNATTPGYDVYASALANGGLGWDPIGDQANPFTGRFDGQGRVISDLVIQRSTQDYVGLFGYVHSTHILDVVLQSTQVEGQNYVGGLVGAVWNSDVTFASYLENLNLNVGSVQGVNYVGGITGGIIGASSYSGTISYISRSIVNFTVVGLQNVGGGAGYLQKGRFSSVVSSGSVQGDAFVGGLVGYLRNTDSWILDSASTGDVTSVTGGASVGGLVGQSQWDHWMPLVERSFATGDVFSTGDYVGGLIGQNVGHVRSSYATGNVSGRDYVGGLLGVTLNPVEIRNNYASGDVSGNDKVGGFIGGNDHPCCVDSNIERGFSIGSVSGNLNVGGFIGINDLGVISESYWDTQVSGVSVSDGGTGLTTSQMQQQSSYTGWDFGSVWSIDGSTNSGYPYLQWEN